MTPADSTMPPTALLSKIDERTATVVLVGQGYVGLPVAMRAVDVGFPVVGYEVDERRVELINEGVSYVEDVPDDALRRALAGGYRATSSTADLEGFDIAVISVPTPLRDGVPDLAHVEDAATEIGRFLRPGCLVVLESTTYPGTTAEVVGPILQQASGLAEGQFFLGYSPERIDPGNPHWSFESIPKVVSGIDDGSLQCVEAFYASIVEKVVPVASTYEAELCKLLENTFRHVNIALVNELAMFARELGVDIWNAIDAAATKPFGYMRFTPGPGVGGHCLPVDPSYLSWRVRQHVGHAFRFVELANDINEHMPDYLCRRITGLLNQHALPVSGSRILLLGITYKASTSDFRESPSIPVAEELSRLNANLRICDPHLPDTRPVPVDAPVVPFTTEELEAADLVVVLVDHPEFDPDRIAAEARLVFDAKGILRGRPFRGEIL